MKNIFLIPTDKESRLWRDLDSNKLTFDNLSKPNSNECTKCSNEYVYITSDEKFIRDEYITDGLEVIKATPKLVDAQGLVDRRDWKKIVMTNDLELIENGIQQIGDLFFRWFVLNPYCKEIEIGKTNKLIDNYAEKDEDKWEVRYHIYTPKKNFYCGDEVDYGEQCSFQCENCNDATGVDYGYITKASIEVKDEMVRPLMVPKNYFGEVETFKHKVESIPKEEILANRSNAYEFIDFDKQETLEEGFDRIFDSIDFVEFDFASFKLGSKWQMERSYSEEEAKRMAFDFYYDMSKKMNVPENLITENFTNLEVWFEKYKKK